MPVAVATAAVARARAAVARARAFVATAAAAAATDGLQSSWFTRDRDCIHPKLETINVLVS